MAATTTSTALVSLMEVVLDKQSKQSKQRGDLLSFVSLMGEQVYQLSEQSKQREV